MGWENKASGTEDVCASVSSTCPLPLCWETRKARLAEGFLPSPVPGGSDLGFLRSLSSLALPPLVSWGPEQGNKGREWWEGDLFVLRGLSAGAFPGESFLLTSCSSVRWASGVVRPDHDSLGDHHRGRPGMLGRHGLRKEGGVWSRAYRSFPGRGSGYAVAGRRAGVLSLTPRGPLLPCAHG